VTAPAPTVPWLEKVLPATLEVLGQYEGQLTVRQVHYRLVSDPYRLFPNTRAKYKDYDDHLTRWRERGLVPGDRFVDRGRSVIGGEGTTYSGPHDYLETTLAMLESVDDFRLSRWDGVEVVPEVWVEKDALAFVILDAVREWGVRVFGTRGISSYTKLVEAVSRLGENHVVIYLSDHDPTGKWMEDDLGARMGRYGSGAKIERVALTTTQVRRHRLAPNFVKKADSRSPAYVAEFGDQCWELDALPPDVLRGIVRDAVGKYVDEARWAEIAERERSGRRRLDRALEGVREALRERLEDLDDGD
jgi:hypothetical protein